MFTGIVETMGEIVQISREGTNAIFKVQSPISKDFTIDQSVCHDGVCLTVVKSTQDTHEVVAIDETLNRSCLGKWQVGSKINLERSMVMNGRLDGHIVQGHVDDTGKCIGIEDKDGSKIFSFSYNPKYAHLLIDKGSISINGISLTLIDPSTTEFKVAIIPYTFENTNFKYIGINQIVNLEFDLIGKYLSRFSEVYTDNIKA